MKIVYLGTGSAEGVPALFCHCLACQKAKTAGGENRRGRQQVLVNQDLLIDFSPDTFRNQFQQSSFDSAAVTYLLLTHSHGDHFYLADLLQHQQVVTAKPLKIYGSEAVGQQVLSQIAEGQGLDYQAMVPFRRYILGDYTVIPLIAAHSSKETCFNYIIEQNDTRYLYIHDSGFLPVETWQFLTSYQGEFQVVSLDCNELFAESTSDHMNVTDNQRVRERLLILQLVTSQTPFILSHFSHKAYLLHEELVDRLHPYGLIPAYDNFTITL